MSVKQMDRVFDFSESTGTARLVLLALADVAGNDGLVTAYARSQTELARKARCSITSVRRAIDQLEELGEVQVLSDGHGRAQSNYQIVLHPRQLGGAQNEGAPPPSCTLSPANLAGQPHQDDGAIIPSLPVDTPSLPQPRAVDRFDEFWEAYAHKVDRAKAMPAWNRAIKRADPDRIIVGALAYAAARVSQHKRYWKHPTSWLNADAWDNDLSRFTAPALDTKSDRRHLNLIDGAQRVKAGDTWENRFKAMGAQPALNEGTNQ